MEKLHGKVANSQGIGCESTIVIVQGILIGSSECIEIGAIDGSKSIFKEQE